MKLFCFSLFLSTLPLLAACTPSPLTPASVPSVTPSATGCQRGGCSGQLCLEAGSANDIITTCEYRAEYGCYQNAVCERQTTGQCAFTNTPILQQCLKEAAASPPAVSSPE